MIKWIVVLEFRRYRGVGLGSESSFEYSECELFVSYLSRDV